LLKVTLLPATRRVMTVVSLTMIMTLRLVYASF